MEPFSAAFLSSLDGRLAPTRQLFTHNSPTKPTSTTLGVKHGATSEFRRLPPALRKKPRVRCYSSSNHCSTIRLKSVGGGAGLMNKKTGFLAETRFNVALELPVKKPALR